MQQMKVAIYCRVSTESQREADTIASQKSTLPKFAETQGWTVHDIYVDEGLSGSWIDVRPDFMRLLEDMEKRSFDILLVAEHSRVTRSEDPQERGRILKLLKDNKIKLASPAEGILDLSMFTGELMTTLKLMFASEEKAEMVRRFIRGRREKLTKGIYCLTNVPYGLKKIVDKSVTPIKHEVLIDPHESQVLRTVFDLIVKEGWSINDCAYHLNKNGVKTRKGKTWHVGNLSAILRNEGSLTGKIYAGRYQWKTTAGGKQKLLDVKPKSESIVIQVPPIFTKAEYTALREKIEGNKRDHLIKKEGFLLRGKLKCAMCGATYRPSTGGNVKQKMVRYYACSNRLKSPKRREPGETPCKAPFVNAQMLDHIVEQNLIYSLFARPEKTLQKWTGTKAERHRLERIEGKVKRVEGDLAANDKAQQKVLRAFLDDVFTEEQVKAEQHRLKAQRKLLEEEQERLREERLKARKIQADLTVVKEAGTQIEDLAKQAYKKFKSMTFDDKRRLIGHLIPPGTYMEIYPCREEDIRLRKAPGMARKVKIDWDFTYSGLLNLEAVIAALQVFTKTNEMPDPSVTYTEVGYKTFHGCVTG